MKVYLNLNECIYENTNKENLRRPTQILILTIKVDHIFNQMQSQPKRIINVQFIPYDQTKNQKVNLQLCHS